MFISQISSCHRGTTIVNVTDTEKWEIISRANLIDILLVYKSLLQAISYVSIDAFVQLDD